MVGAADSLEIWVDGWDFDFQRTLGHFLLAPFHTSQHGGSGIDKALYCPAESASVTFIAAKCP